MCETFYDTKLVYGDKEESQKDLEDSIMNKLDEYSFMQNKTDDVDKIRYYWAYNLPCAVLVCSKAHPAFWKENLKDIYDLLYKDVLLNVRTALAAGFKEIIQLLDIQ